MLRIVDWKRGRKKTPNLTLRQKKKCERQGNQNRSNVIESYAICKTQSRNAGNLYHDDVSDDATGFAGG